MRLFSQVFGIDWGRTCSQHKCRHDIARVVKREMIPEHTIPVLCRDTEFSGGDYPDPGELYQLRVPASYQLELTGSRQTTVCDGSDARHKQWFERFRVGDTVRVTYEPRGMFGLLGYRIIRLEPLPETTSETSRESVTS